MTPQLHSDSWYFQRYSDFCAQNATPWSVAALKGPAADAQRATSDFVKRKLKPDAYSDVLERYSHLCAGNVISRKHLHKLHLPSLYMGFILNDKKIIETSGRIRCCSQATMLQGCEYHLALKDEAASKLCRLHNWSKKASRKKMGRYVISLELPTPEDLVTFYHPVKPELSSHHVFAFLRNK
nr:hypothetical protein [Tanacetum cinerariifolium]